MAGRTVRGEKTTPIEDVLADAILDRIGRRPTREYRPTKFRRWRIDLAFVRQKLAIEVEGRQHGRAKQHRSDSEKQNFLEEHGWTCLRYPASTVLAKSRLPRVVDQIERVLAGVTDATAATTTITG